MSAADSGCEFLNGDKPTGDLTDVCEDVKSDMCEDIYNC